MLSTKDPAEIITVTFDFSTVAVSLTGATVTATVASGKKDISPQLIVSGVASVTGSQAMQRVAGGVDETTYDLRCVAVDADGEIHVAVGRLPVERARP